MDNIRGWALKKVQRAMATAKLSDSLLVSVGQPHPPVAGRPAAWGTPEASSPISSPCWTLFAAAVTKVGGFER